MLKDKFLLIGAAYIHIDSIRRVIAYDDGSVRVYIADLADSENGRYWLFEGEQASRITAFFAEHSTKV